MFQTQTQEYNECGTICSPPTQGYRKEMLFQIYSWAWACSFLCIEGCPRKRRTGQGDPPGEHGCGGGRSCGVSGLVSFSHSVAFVQSTIFLPSNSCAQSTPMLGSRGGKDQMWTPMRVNPDTHDSTRGQEWREKSSPQSPDWRARLGSLSLVQLVLCMGWPLSHNWEYWPPRCLSSNPVTLEVTGV
jgi:hypothetical protein